MVEGTAETLQRELEPVVAALNLELFDVEVSAGLVRVTVRRPGGIDLDALAEANRAVSAALDQLDPIPGRYLLEVSSPGVERRLRTPAQFAGALDETLSVRLLPGTGGERRLRGRLVSADEDGIVVEGPEIPGGSATVAYASIERARTVFEWGAKPAPSPSRGKGSGGRERVHTS
jgi:ribosome maturation factor RimP